LHCENFQLALLQFHCRPAKSLALSQDTTEQDSRHEMWDQSAMRWPAQRLASTAARQDSTQTGKAAEPSEWAAAALACSNAEKCSRTGLGAANAGKTLGFRIGIY